MKISKNRVGFGTWQLSGENSFGGRVTGWGKTNIDEAKKAINIAVEQGIDFFDTADSYGHGLSEKILGETIGNNSNVSICTKYGNVETIEGKSYQDFSEKHLYFAVENSLKRLKREAIDVLLLHSPPDDFDWKSFDTNPFEQLKKEGKIKKYGVSSKSLKGAKSVLLNNFGEVIESIYNVLDRRAENEVLPLCFTNHIDFIARVPLASGFVSSKWLTESPTFGNNDIRSLLPQDAFEWFIENNRNLSFLDDLEGGLSVSALRFCISNEAVTVVIPGIRQVVHAQQAILADKLGKLPKEIIEKIALAVPDVFPPWR